MSSITQARLAPITQRYMSMSFRRQDWSDKSMASALTSLDLTNTNSDQNSKQALHPAPTGSRFGAVKSHTLNLIDREQKFPRRGIRCRASVSSLNPEALVKKCCRHGGVSVFREHQQRKEAAMADHSAYTYPSHRQTILSMLSNDDSLEVNQSNSNILFNGTNELTVSRISPSSQGRPLQRYLKNERRRYRNSESDGRDSFNHKPFCMALAILGLFRKPTDEEIEEEKARLSDAQKVKKMKPVELKIARGVLSMCDQEFGRADRLFHEALDLAQDEQDEERENLILNLIAANYFEGGELDKAEKLFIDIMKRMIARDVAPTAPPILELSLKLASIYSKNPATQEKASKGFKFVINSLLYNLEDIVNNIEELDIQSISDEKRDELALLGWSYDWFAKHLLAMNDYGGAADMLQRAVQISSLVLGPLHDQTLILLNDIGTTLAMNNSPEEGQIFIRKAVEGAIANQSKELASFYVNLGLVNLKLSKLDEAKRYCEYSMELAKKNRDHYNTQEVIELSQTCLDEVRKLLDAEGQ